jgi:hypothetical protein
MAKRKASKSTTTAHLIVSDEPEPQMRLKPGMKFEVHATSVVDSALRPSTKVAARLCGGTTTCIALVKV